MFQNELARIMTPGDLHAKNKDRKNVVIQGRIMTNWIHKSLSRKSIKDFRMSKSPTSAIKNVTLSDDLEVMNSPHSPTRPITVVAINSKKEGKRATGRERAYLSGCTNRRRDETFKIIENDFAVQTIDHSRMPEMLSSAQGTK